MRLFSREGKSNMPAQGSKKSIFEGKTFRNHQTEDYSQYSKQDLFALFKCGSWNIKTQEEKIAVLQEVENREATAHNRPAAKIAETYGSDYGGYFFGTHRIEIRLTDNQFEDLDTLFHESEHANQNRSSISSVNFSEDDRKLMRIEDMTSSDGKNSHYRKYEEPLYSVMTSELDANNVALEKLSLLNDEYKNEEKYQAYLINRQEYYGELTDEIDKKSSAKKSALLDTVESAFARNELSYSEYIGLRSLIANTENFDSCQKKAKDIGEILSKVDLQEKSNISKLSLTNTSIESLKSVDEKNQANVARYQMVDAAQIKDINFISNHFWNHHGYEKEDYLELASKLSEIQQEFKAGKTYAEIKANPELQDSLTAYCSDDKMIQVLRDQEGNYHFQDDGRHRVMAAQELGLQIPVNVVNYEEPLIANYYENLQKSDIDNFTADEAKKTELGSLNNRNAHVCLSANMSEDNSGRNDYTEYSQNPAWSELSAEGNDNCESPLLSSSRETTNGLNIDNENEISGEESKMLDAEPVVVKAEIDQDDVTAKTESAWRGFDAEENMTEDIESMSSIIIDDLDNDECWELGEEETSVMIENLSNDDAITGKIDNSEMITDLEAEDNAIYDSESDSQEWSHSDDLGMDEQ